MIPPTDTVAAASSQRISLPAAACAPSERRNWLDTASLPPAPANEDVRRLHARFTLAFAIPIPRSPDPTTAATGHRGTHASSRRSCRCPLASAAPLSRVPQAAPASIGGQPTPCLRRLLQLEAWVRAATQPTPVHAHRRAVDVVTRPRPRRYRRSCVLLVLDAAAASSSARCFWALRVLLVAEENSLESNTKSTTVLAALAAVRPLAVASCHVLRLTWMWNSFVCVWWGVCVYIYMCVFGVYKCVNTTSGTH